jgi:hypothetical protein
MEMIEAAAAHNRSAMVDSLEDWGDVGRDDLTLRLSVAAGYCWKGGGLARHRMKCSQNSETLPRRSDRKVTYGLNHKKG